ncbi:GCN5-related N-acetyltransferase [Gluconacetobacter diazotrophicus PA1 5]|uniref:GNAT family N-acetyltransferase n=2 Tax=Gluconacetobacter diazotrophicus TaxID=33996 RepID=A0A7W4FE99_GLUDI|nr:GNAT family N-acetyltransferase [Gluconacetobacter diazotrophicus]ACI50915.1 GCN5-related N-acetyltransferase [Gluconacetobacter diazotrophicus PA1 5]MBB2156150.1 GNAT family N-acetyltransferase [Gluconacetobacter diazotrophicus]TWB08630.1 ribosomal protein S18 acetylase RimI-like enzyme [Gluconacetobacter diazotrophicus]
MPPEFPADSDPRSLWRAMCADDLPAVMDLAARIHPDYPEGEAVFAERLALCPAGCLVLPGAEGLVGYVLSHPWRVDGPPALDSALGALPAVPDCWYLHDIALLPPARGQGAAAAALALIGTRAAQAGLGRIALIATGQAAAYWRRAGFTPLDQPDAATVLRSYDPRAQLMARGV